MLEAALIAFMVWILLGAFLVYAAQGQMKKWYQLELYAHDKIMLDKLAKTYEKIF